jgi:O-acetyl-ADP-ribose deacetylase
MRKGVLDVYVDVVTEEEALHSLLVAPGDHVPFVGAGVSKEAGVALADEISVDIRRRLESLRPGIANDAWARDYLNWDDPSRRYGTALERYGPAEDRVNYFRSLLRNKRPSFSHHAITLLMAHDKLHGTALTTNFDKLLEGSFTEQNLRECQAIRMVEEAEFWGQERDKCYVFKLHGDYDTHNILNTRSETRSIPSFFLELARTILRGRGLLVLGSAGNEQSIVEFMHDLLSSTEMRVLSRGIKWGVFVGPRKPAQLSDEQSTEAVVTALERGTLNRRLVELLSDMNDKFGDRRPCSVFPIWGSSHFLLRLIEGAGDGGLVDSAKLLLDHDQRLTTLFRSQGVTSEAVERHLGRLAAAQVRLERATAATDVAPRLALETSVPTGALRIVYGDITGRSVMMQQAEPGRRAGVVSPEDTLLSAGGGVALTLADKAGLRTILNELSKLAPIAHGTAAVTSAGNLPVQYIFHAAALKIDVDGEYHVAPEMVEAAIRDVLAKAAALDVERLLVPLLGAGVAGLSPAQSLRAIVRAVVDAPVTGLDRRVTVVIFDEGVLGQDDVRDAVNDCAVIDTGHVSSV